MLDIQNNSIVTEHNYSDLVFIMKGDRLTIRPEIQCSTRNVETQQAVRLSPVAKLWDLYPTDCRTTLLGNKVNISRESLLYDTRPLISCFIMLYRWL